MHGIAASIGAEVRATARTASLGVLGLVFALVGIGFLTVALWLFVVTVGSALIAAVIIGALYCAVGCLLLAIAASRSRAQERAKRLAAAQAAPDARSPFVQMAEGFAIGLQAGRSARGR